MIRKCIFILLLITILPKVEAQSILEDTSKQLLSPDGNYLFTFYQKQFPDERKQMYYTLSYKGKTVIEESELGVLIENQLFESALAIPNDTSKQWSDNLLLTSVETKTVDETWRPVYGERAEVRDHYNELVLKFQKGGVPETESNSTASTVGHGQAYDKDSTII